MGISSVFVVASLRAFFAQIGHLFAKNSKTFSLSVHARAPFFLHSL
jgi:hypothetical protein